MLSVQIDFAETEKEEYRKTDRERKRERERSRHTATKCSKSIFSAVMEQGAGL